MEINKLTIKEASQGLSSKEFSSVELTKACLQRIGERNRHINAFITVNNDLALEMAEEADKKISSGMTSSLTGIPFGIKDAICVEDVRSTGAAKILDNYISPYQATVVSKLLAEGSVIVGKQNCDSFGHGASNENSMYGPVKNPLSEDRVAGGSSGGSAAALADNMCLFSVAEDTGGSIRQPASFCGVVGFRPSYGRNSRYGIMPMASSLDVVGPMARSVEDIATIMEAMAGQDEKDATTVPDKVPEYTKEINKSVKGLKVGLPVEYYDNESINDEVKKVIEAQKKVLEDLGCEVVEVNLNHTKYAVPTYYLIVPSEDSSNMARLDGIRYGKQVEGSSLYEVYANSRQKGFPEEVKRRIMVGTYALSAGYYDAYYKKAQKVRTLISNDFETVFNEVDLIFTPTAPNTAFKLGEKSNDLLAMYLQDVFVAPAALAGVPALSIPIGKDGDGLSIGGQIIGARMHDSLVMRLGHALEKANK